VFSALQILSRKKRKGTKTIEETRLLSINIYSVKFISKGNRNAQAKKAIVVDYSNANISNIFPLRVINIKIVKYNGTIF